MKLNRISANTKKITGRLLYAGFAAALLLLPQLLAAQQRYELNSGWVCKPLDSVQENGAAISQVGYSTASWMAATIPGTVLTTLLNQHKIPDPAFGMNNNIIPDIYRTGSKYYTYWFTKNFNEPRPKNGGQVYLNFRGINYSAEVYLNGRKVNSRRLRGMFLRRSFNITSLLTVDGNNRLAVLVYPPDDVGNPNGGQGGDGTIARGVGLQYTAGWDWIQPVHDRNTGIWDKVTIEKTGAVRISSPHVVTLVPGVRYPDAAYQQPATIKVSAELENAAPGAVKGFLQYQLNGQTIAKAVTVPGRRKITVQLNDYSLKNPKLWWPNGYGPQNLYPLNIQFIAGGQISDKQILQVGVRQLQNEWNVKTESRQLLVNGQRIFVKGGNWIVSDWMLRLSAARYDAEVRFHHDMNLNLIRVWGGAMVERPEFYDACDKYGMLVFQDLWGSGDCNGRWTDPMKLDDQWTRRKYPADHQLFLASAEDQVKMVRNHASLAVWCGGNEITPPEDILLKLRDSIFPKLDDTRWFVEYSNADSMSRNRIGGNGDGPYGIQPLPAFWAHQTFPFNSEVGSVGLNDYESLKRFLPAENLKAPLYNEKTRRGTVDSVWDYHKYIGYDTSVSRYGPVKNLEDFAARAQLVNYDQYRGLMEGFSAHQWDWYTGVIIWKTQNPWTAMRGQMYDWYLDPNAGLYGLHHGSEALHIMYNPVDGMVTAVNNTFAAHRNLMLVVKAIDMAGKETLLTQSFVEINASTTKKYLSLKKEIDRMANHEGLFLVLQLLDENKEPVSENTYWLPDANNNYLGLQRLAAAPLQIKAKKLPDYQIEVTLTNEAHGALAFFNRVSLTNPASGERILPVFYSDNYISVLPGGEKKIWIDYRPDQIKSAPQVTVEGWNVKKQSVNIYNW